MIQDSGQLNPHCNSSLTCFQGHSPVLELKRHFPDPAAANLETKNQSQSPARGVKIRGVTEYRFDADAKWTAVDHSVISAAETTMFAHRLYINTTEDAGFQISTASLKWALGFKARKVHPQ